MERERGVKKGVLSTGHPYHHFQGKYPPAFSLESLKLIFSSTHIVPFLSLFVSYILFLNVII